MSPVSASALTFYTVAIVSGETTFCSGLSIWSDSLNSIGAFNLSSLVSGYGTLARVSGTSHSGLGERTVNYNELS